jgi:hypothetical protein
VTKGRFTDPSSPFYSSFAVRPRLRRLARLGSVIAMAFIMVTLLAAKDEPSDDHDNGPHDDKEHGHHGGIGGGVTIDISTMTRDKKEDDPFGPSDHPHTTDTIPNPPLTHTTDETPALKFGVLLLRDEDWWIPSYGSSTTLHAYIYEWDPVKGWVYPSTVPKIIHFDLQSSDEPGICCNANAPYGVDHDDLEIDSELNSTLEVLSKDYAMTRNPDTSARIAVRCWDWGAYGVVHATADGCEPLQKLPDGSVHVATGPQRKLRPNEHFTDGTMDYSEQELPRDKNGNYIADQYEEDQNYHPRYNEDIETYPAGNVNYPGDGLSAYEEYRGFIIHRQHRRTDWKVKDLFIWDRDGMGFGDFPYASSLECWSILPSEMKGGDVSKTADGRLAYGADFRTINFNSKTGKLHDQTALVLADEPNLSTKAPEAEQEAWLKDPRNKDKKPKTVKVWGLSTALGPPIYVDVVEVDRGYHDQMVSKDSVRGKLNGITRFELPATITHELGHAVGIEHHGIPSGKWVWLSGPSASTKGPKGLPVVVVPNALKIGETGMYLKSDFSLPGLFYICVKHGVYSGEAECYMRYVHPPHSLYRIGKGNDDWESPSLDNALKMHEFCGSKEGTQFNAGNHCGSSSGENPCLQQIVVNDDAPSKDPGNEMKDTDAEPPPAAPPAQPQVH